MGWVRRYSGFRSWLLDAGDAVGARASRRGVRGWCWRPLSKETAMEGEDGAESAVPPGAAEGTIWAIRSPRVT